MTLWRILLHGLPTHGAYKAIYDRQRRNNAEYRKRENAQKRSRYQTNPEKQLSINRSYKARFIQRHGLEAWNARQREYLRQWRARKQGEEVI